MVVIDIFHFHFRFFGVFPSEGSRGHHFITLKSNPKFSGQACKFSAARGYRRVLGNSCTTQSSSWAASRYENHKADKTSMKDSVVNLYEKIYRVSEVRLIVRILTEKKKTTKVYI